MQQEMSDNSDNSDNNDKVYFAVIDTNVLVSALISRNPFSPPVRVLRAFTEHSKFTPLYHDQIMIEYTEVLHRPKFHIDDERILTLLDDIYTNGTNMTPSPTDVLFRNPKDFIFYEVAMEKEEENGWLFTGIMKHFPVEKFMVTPEEFMDIADNHIEPWRLCIMNHNRSLK